MIIIIVAFAVNGDASKCMTDEVHNIFEQYGFKENSLKDEGYSFAAIVNRKQCVGQQYSNTVLMEDRWIDGVHLVVKSCGTGVEGETAIASIKVDGVEVSKNQQGLNIVVYDKRLGKVVDSVCFNLHSEYQKTN